ncbi:MAG: extracellular solute-binding protein [Myxococcota bacterium]|nr:extracellular solute-binding protein [Myxococcota bacterium]
MLWALLSAATAIAETPTLKIWHAYRGDEQAALEKVIKAYDESEDGIDIEILAVPYDSFVSKLEAAAPRGNGPDLFIAAHERIGAWSASGLIQPFSAITDDLHPATVEALSYDGQLFGMPMAYKCLALIINTDILSEPPATTDELLDMTPTLLEKGITPLAYQATEPYYHAAWLHGFGGKLFDGSGKAVLNDPANVESLAFVQKLQDQKVVPEEPTSALISQLFNDGNAAAVINGPWFLGEINDNINYEVHPLPRISDNNQAAAPFLTVDGAMISGYATDPNAAAKLAQHLASTKSATRRAIEGKQSVATLSAYDNPQIANDPVIGAFRRQLDATVPMPNRPEMSATWEPMARAVRRISRKALTPQAALDQAQTEFDIVTRPPPPPANPTIYIILALMGLLGLVGWLGLQIRNHFDGMKKHWSAYLYVAPAAIAMTALTAIPFVVGAAVSLFAYRDGGFTFVGMANFFDIIFARDWPVTSSLSFYFTLGVTVLWTLSNVFLHVSIGVALAMLLREPWLKLRGIYRVLLILPWAVPNYITALIWKGMFHRQFGAINALLEAVGIGGISWFSQFSTAFAANVVTNTWLGFPFMMVVTLGALQSIPRDLEQAASVDGASGWQRFWHITLPLLKPALLPAVVLGSVWTFNMFNIIYLVSGGEPDSSTDILISDAYRWAFTRGNRYGYASAYAVLIFVILVLYGKIGNKIAGRKTI